MCPRGWILALHSPNSRKLAFGERSSDYLFCSWTILAVVVNNNPVAHAVLSLGLVAPQYEMAVSTLVFIKLAEHRYSKPVVPLEVIRSLIFDLMLALDVGFVLDLFDLLLRDLFTHIRGRNNLLWFFNLGFNLGGRSRGRIL
jgi:hypothetical protein